MLSAMMKKRQQKEARKEMDQDGKNDWSTPDFVKKIFADFVDKGESELEEVPYTELEEELDLELIENEIEEKSHIPPPAHKVNFSVSQRGQTVGTIKHKERKKKPPHYKFFKHQDDVRMAMIYKEIMDKPRALRHSIR